MIPTGGDGSAYVKYKNAGIVVGAGSTDQLTVGRDETTVANDLSVLGGGQLHTLVYARTSVLQGTAPFMTASQMSGSAVGMARLNFVSVPMRKAGSLVGISVWAGANGGLVKSGTLTATVCNGTAGTTVTSLTAAMTTGSVGTGTVVKDLVTFAANDLISVQLTASSAYLSEPDVTSASFYCLVDVEY